jgi:hypothetical protein
MWNRQRQWEMKRDIVLGFARLINEFDQAVLIFGIKIQNRSTSPYGAAEFQKALEAWNIASNEFEQESYVVGLVVSAKTQGGLFELRRALRDASTDILKEQNKDAYVRHHKNIVEKLEIIRSLIREELGIAPITPQSSESTAAPTPPAQK